ncbi:hypothetical protein CKO11_15775 [Rhodobacter sp. TJ_12]|uniref:hypothetical protein n=1 Tax=Rhodobacter sp. TJ_12 TaxID=2029399 RepID=UPI001CBCC15A|nr:hypothetical protein [Rhodobacter sp. TJ_12]MBZ4023910.1 hypothetical protein [Rhodobacter sp. TJ_12]
MTRFPLLSVALLTGLVVGLAACAAPQAEVGRITYEGVETRLLDDDLVGFQVAVTGTTNRARATAYANCAAAQYAMIRGYGFARHVRTNVQKQGTGVSVDAVYLISDAIPRGLRTIEAEVMLNDCRERGIPTV